MDLNDLTIELEEQLSLMQSGKKGPSAGDAFDEWLFVPEGAQPASGTNKATEEQNLEKWLKGANDRVDFRTASALSRRLDKKRRKMDKERRLKNNNNAERNALAMIEEVSSESGPMSDRETSMRRREKENMAARKAISEASVCSEDFDEYDELEEEEDEEEEEYFDAPSTPKKTPSAVRLPANGGNNRSPARQAQQHFLPSASSAQMAANSRRVQRMMGGAGGGGQTLPRTTASGAAIAKRHNANIYNTAGRNAKANQFSTRKQSPSRSTAVRHQQQFAEEEEQLEVEVPTEWRNLGDIQRRAKEQERELQLELQRNRRARLGAAANRSRPESASSSASSVRSGGNGILPTSSKQPQPFLATSKSVDFRSSSGHIADQSSVASSRSNEGSLADLSGDCLNQPPNSRLPLPRRPTIPGKTGIPLPTPKRNKMALAQRKIPFDDQQLNDDECF